MKKTLILIVALILSFSMFTACGVSAGCGDIGSTDTDASAGGGDTAQANDPTIAIQVPSSPVDVEDPSNYFVTIGSKQLNLVDTTVQDLIDFGLTVKEDDLNREVPPDTGGGLKETYQPLIMLMDGERCFSVSAYNYGSAPVPLKDCTVMAVTLTHRSAGVTLVCNVAMGCTIEDIISVFGEGYDHKTQEDFGHFFYRSETSDRAFMFVPRQNDINTIRSIGINLT